MVEILTAVFFPVLLLLGVLGVAALEPGPDRGTPDAGSLGRTPNSAAHKASRERGGSVGIGRPRV